MAISVCSSVFMFRLLKTLPRAAEAQRRNLNRVGLYGAIGPVTDIVLIILTALTISPGDYGTGVELLSGLVVLLSYLPIVLINVIKLKKRFALSDGDWTERDTYLMKCGISVIYHSIPYKCILFMLIPISLEPYYIGLLEKMIL